MPIVADKSANAEELVLSKTFNIRSKTTCNGTFNVIISLDHPKQGAAEGTKPQYVAIVTFRTRDHARMADHLAEGPPSENVEKALQDLLFVTSAALAFELAKDSTDEPAQQEVAEPQKRGRGRPKKNDRGACR